MRQKPTLASALNEGGYWFSKNPDKAWAEKFFLAYLPFFFALNAGKQVFGWMNAGTVWHLGQNLLMWVPLLLLPLILRRESSTGIRWHASYWFKANLWIAIFAFIATYFFTEYFFDVLGMIYFFPQVSVYFDSVLLGSGEQRVPLGVYFSGITFFVIYHNLAVICLRRTRTSAWNWGRVSWCITVVVTALFFAWAETRLVATDKNAPYFAYRDLAWMLRYGSVFYACYFLVSFPMFYQLDEGRDEHWSLSYVCTHALAASMLVFLLLDIASRFMPAF